MFTQRRTRPAGFTLIELLIVVVIIGVLATVAVARYNRVKQRGQLAAVQSDLRNLVVQQERYHMENLTYTNDVGLMDFQLTSGVDLTISVANVTGWAATANHLGDDDIECGVFVGSTTPADAPPATTPEVIACVY